MKYAQARRFTSMGFVFYYLCTMPATFNLGKHKLTVPNSWDECFTKLFFELSAADHSDYIEMLAILSGLPSSIISQARQLDLDTVLDPHLEWMGTKINWEDIKPPKEINFGVKKLTVPTDLELESFGQKVVMDGIIDECTKTKGKKTTVNFSKLIPATFAVYFAHKYYGKDFDRDLVDQFIPIVGELPIMTVYPIGAFFLRTYFGFGSSTLFDSLMIETTMSWLRRLRSWINSGTSKLSTHSLGATS